MGKQPLALGSLLTEVPHQPRFHSSESKETAAETVTATISARATPSTGGTMLTAHTHHGNKVRDILWTDVSILVVGTITNLLDYVGHQDSLCSASAGARPYAAEYFPILCTSTSPKWLKSLRLLPHLHLVLLDLFVSMPPQDLCLQTAVVITLLMWLNVLLLARWHGAYANVRSWLVVVFRTNQYIASCLTMLAGYPPSLLVTLYLPYCGFAQLWASQFFWASRLSLHQHLFTASLEFVTATSLLALTVINYPGLLSHPMLILLEMITCTALTVAIAMKRHRAQRAAAVVGSMQGVSLHKALAPSTKYSMSWEAAAPSSPTGIAEFPKQCNAWDAAVRGAPGGNRSSGEGTADSGQSMTAAAATLLAADDGTPAPARHQARPMARIAYRSLAQRSTIHVKIQSASPHQLPPDWLERLNAGLLAETKCCVASACVRKGCIELMLNLRPSSGSSSQDGAATANPDEAHAAAVMCRIVAEMLHANAPMSVQLPDGYHYESVAPAAADEAWALQLTSTPPPPAPVMTQLSPCILHLPGNKHNAPALLTFTVFGTGLEAPGVEFLVSCQGRYIPMTVLQSGHYSADAGSSSSSITLSCPVSALPQGAAMLQVVARRQRSASNDCMLLVLRDEHMVTELSQLPLLTEDDQELQAVLQDLGAWVELVQARSAAVASTNTSGYDGTADMAPGSVDISAQLTGQQHLKWVEGVMVPIAGALLRFFVNLGWEHCACSILLGLLNPNLGWSAGPQDMWDQLNAPGVPSLLELSSAADSTDSLTQRLSAIASSAGCVMPVHEESKAVAQPTVDKGASMINDVPAPQAPAIQQALGAANASLDAGSSSSNSSSFGSSSRTPAVRFLGGPRPVSALRALLWGFSDPQMEARHRANLHAAATAYIPLLAVVSCSMASVDVMRVIFSGESLIKATPFAVWASGYLIVDQIQRRCPRLYASYVEAWPVLLFIARFSAAMWFAAHLPVRAAQVVMLRSGFGRFATFSNHILMPVLFCRTRLILTLLSWSTTSVYLCLLDRSLGGCTSLQCLLLCQVLPCGLACGVTVYHDYKGRAALMRQAQKKKDV